jgi:hypothetical protein
MIISETYDCKIGGRSATMRVLRNNGMCWGRLVIGHRQYDVVTSRDQYERADDEAAATFIRAAQRGNKEEAVGWDGI